MATKTTLQDPVTHQPIETVAWRFSQGKAPGTPLDRSTLLANGIVGFEPGDPRSRNFAMLRSRLLRRLDRTGMRVIAVTSARAGNGKSFVAANLAAALCKIHPVWLVDLDLRRPCIADRFGLSVGEGVDDYLAGDTPLGAWNFHLGEDHLTILPIRQSRPNSAEILASSRTEDLFSFLRSTPDNPVCIIDTPPVLEGDDMIILTRHVDALLLVVEEGRTRQNDLREALRVLQPTPLIGTVLNRSLFQRQSDPYGQYHVR